MTKPGNEIRLFECLIESLTHAAQKVAYPEWHGRPAREIKHKMLPLLNPNDLAFEASTPAPFRHPLSLV